MFPGRVHSHVRTTKMDNEQTFTETSDQHKVSKKTGLDQAPAKCITAEDGYGRYSLRPGSPLLCGYGDEQRGWPTQCHHTCAQQIQQAGRE
jgi:hypothetical protein